MAAVKPDEISSILREQLANVKTATELEEVGTVLAGAPLVLHRAKVSEVDRGTVSFAGGSDA